MRFLKSSPASSFLKTLGGIPLRKVESGDGFQVAVVQIARLLDDSHGTQLASALPRLIALATPTPGILGGSGHPGHPEVLDRAHDLFPEANLG